MDTSVWLTNAMMWVAIAMSAVVLWTSREKVLSRPSGRTLFQAMVGMNIALAIVALVLTLFTTGYGQGKARALEENRADEQALS